MATTDRIEKITCDPGDSRVVTATITDPDTGDLINPTTVKAHLRSPAGETFEYVYGEDDELQRPSTGIYEFTLAIPYEAAAKQKWRGDIQALNAAGVSVEVAVFAISVREGTAV